MIRSIIIDDEQHCVRALLSDLQQHCPSVEVVDSLLFTQRRNHVHKENKSRPCFLRCGNALDEWF